MKHGFHLFHFRVFSAYQMAQPEQVQVRFYTTSKTTFSLPSEIPPIRLPSNLTSAGLAQVIHHLITPSDTENDTNDASLASLAFLVDGQHLLTTSITKYLAAHHLSPEQTLQIEVIESLPEPKPEDCFQHDDWLSACLVTPLGILTGCYDSKLRLWSSSGECTMVINHHSQPIKCVSYGQTQDGRVIVASGSMDRTINVYQVQQNGEWSEPITLKGHEEMVSALVISGTHVISGSFDHTIRLWSFEDILATTAGSVATSEPSSGKKKRTSTPQIKSEATLNAHTGPISTLTLIGSTLTSSSLDHTIRQWDLGTRTLLNLFSTDYAVVSHCQSSDESRLYSAHSDGCIRQWNTSPEKDTKSSGPETKWHAHKAMITRLCTSPTSPYGLMSIAQDGLCKFWDVRSPRSALYTVRVGEEAEMKLFCADWVQERVICGGEEGKLHLFGFGKGAVSSEEQQGK